MSDFGIPETRLTGDPVPCSVFVVKVASRCNLNCHYCYMYNLGDNTYRSQPKVMPLDTVKSLFEAVRRHALRHNILEVAFVLHGGEPLLAGREFFEQFVTLARKILLPQVTPTFTMQTNGVLLDKQWLELLGQLEIEFGISLDGPPEVHDLQRVNHQGLGSYEQVHSAIRLILSDTRYSRLFGSVLAVINPNTDPLRTYNHFRSLGLSGADFLFPDAHHDNPPPAYADGKSPTPYADWLIRIFDVWYDGKQSDFQIRVFENIMGKVLGSPHATDSMGNKTNGILVIETDGSIEPVDVLKVCGDGFTKIGLNVSRNEIDDASEVHLAKIYQRGMDCLCATCTGCEAVEMCAGGYLPHRFSSSRGFDNPSVYCRDLYKLIAHVQSRMVRDLPKSFVDRHNLLSLPVLS